jgi:inner membrane protein
MSETTETLQAGQPASAHAPPRKAMAWLRSPTGKVCMIIGLLLLMQIPLGMVSGLITERETRQQEVQASFTHGWGPEQSFASPTLLVPYFHTVASEPSAPRGLGGSMKVTPSTPRRSGGPIRVTPSIPQGFGGSIRVTPSKLTVSATLKPEMRRRGLFHAVVYTAAISVSGTFTLQAPDIQDVLPADVDWSSARLFTGASDLRGLSPDTRLDWNDQPISLAAADVQSGCGMQMTSLKVPLPGGVPAPGTTVPFHATFTLRGTRAFHLIPFGRRLDVDINSSWPTPSFVGATLPLSYHDGADGFSAHWEDPGAGQQVGWRAGPTVMTNCEDTHYAMHFASDAPLGVALQEAVPTYLMVSRASKYGVLFLTLAYLTVFLFEAMARVRVHLVQYGLLGLSISLFALLLISVAEPLGFLSGYAISMGCVLLQASLYTLSVVHNVRLAAIFAGVLGTLFGFLFIVISLDAYALLVGAVALFVILSVVMFVTRKLDWSGASG